MGTKHRNDVLPVRGLAFGLLLAGCVGAVEAPPPPAPPPGFWAESATRGDTDPVLGEVLDVPGGTILAGYWKYHPATRSFDTSCSRSWGIPYVVSPFRLMRFEVSYAMYAKCVSAGCCEVPEVDFTNDPNGAGSWDDAVHLPKAAGVSFNQARAFCRAYGGDVPTEYQWTRAADGDGETFGIKALTDAYLRCLYNEPEPLCGAFQHATARFRDRIVPFEFPRLPDVGANAWDVGPYGHRDLFAGALEWARLGATPPFDCEHAGAHVETYDVEGGLVTGERESLMQMLQNLVQARLGDEDAELIASVAHGFDSLEVDRAFYFTGFRCAFPPRGAP